MKNMNLFFSEINKVYDCNLTKIRIGNQYDGGYIVLREICEKTKIGYSFGIGDDIGFELDFIKKFPDVKIECFDPTIESLPIHSDNQSFKNLTFKKLGPNSLNKIQNDSLLKMDIEGCEWDAITGSAEMFNIMNLRKFNQILIEVHLLHVEPRKTKSDYFNSLYQRFSDAVNESLFENYYRALKSLNHFFYIVHIHPNNSLPKIAIGEYKFPPLIELSLIRKDLIDVVYDTHTNFPIDGLDSPNKTDRMDIFNFYPIGDKIDE